MVRLLSSWATVPIVVVLLTVSCWAGIKFGESWGSWGSDSSRSRADLEAVLERVQSRLDKLEEREAGARERERRVRMPRVDSDAAWSHGVVR